MVVGSSLPSILQLDRTIVGNGHCPFRKLTLQATREDGSVDTYYYLKNAQGDITHIVSAAGKKMVSYTYDVFGKRTVTYQANGSTTPGQIELLTQMKADLLNPFAYRGYCYDYDMGMYYLQSRYYDPNTGRFINADDTNYLNATGTVLGCNLFAYCENDPVNYVDETGYSFLEKLWSLSESAQKNLEAAKKDLIWHLKNVVSIGYVEKNQKKKYQYYSLKTSYQMSAEKYYKHCLSIHSKLWVHVMYLFNIDLDKYTWYGLSDYRKRELLNLIGSWDVTITQNVGRFYGGKTGFNFILKNLKFKGAIRL